ncbi:calcium-dependent protein kinase [Striga asiatica]|uniref:Calcium-dependent protein kinase n=1 Tax=Striga asiatica TaxID=4170 RepID=A0A5A7QN17_STRAF|nr:calcium-dependent protein kinase [Striga asiatica]
MHGSPTLGDGRRVFRSTDFFLGLAMRSRVLDFKEHPAVRARNRLVAVVQGGSTTTSAEKISSLALSMEKVAGMNEEFQLMATNNKGKIDINELRVGLHKLGYQIPEVDLQARLHYLWGNPCVRQS